MIDLASRPRLASKVRLRFDARSGKQILLYPERGLELTDSAARIVALCGEVSRMPGLGKTPAFMNIDIDGEGRTVGLF